MLRRSINIHERFLRHIWSKQYLRNPLKTSDGRSLEVLNVGRPNSDSGPDFFNAKIKLNQITLKGDVEIHRTLFDWIRHQHQEDPRYNKVVLHVVLEEGGNDKPTFVHSGREIPVLVLEKYLSESIQSIWRKTIQDERAERSTAIRCFKQNNSIAPNMLDRWLTKLAVERLELKLRMFEERLKQLAYEKQMMISDRRRPYGYVPLEGDPSEIPPPYSALNKKDFADKELWEQLIYEGFMEGLGYSKNREPFLKLSRSLTLKKIRGLISQNAALSIESLLFGAAGLIPKIGTLSEKESQEFVRKLSREWKTVRRSIHCELLHYADWQFFPTRPLNFPTLRLAAAKIIIQKIFNEDLFHKIIQSFKLDCPVREKKKELLHLLSIETDDYWNHHYNFESRTSKKITALGSARLYGIIVNSLLPIALLYARIFKDKAVRSGVLQVYNSIPSFENNEITRLMKNQLIKNRLKMECVGKQQALIQLYKYYCEAGRCRECRVGQMIFNPE